MEVATILGTCEENGKTVFISENLLARKTALIIPQVALSIFGSYCVFYGSSMYIYSLCTYLRMCI